MIRIKTDYIVLIIIQLGLFAKAQNNPPEANSPNIKKENTIGTNVRQEISDSINEYESVGMPIPVDSTTTKALKGKVSGLQVKTNGAPPELAYPCLFPSPIKIEAPLYLIDGVLMEKDSLINLNPDEILSVDFLTGNSATALYGKQANGGIIIITTINSEPQNKKQERKKRELLRKLKRRQRKNSK